MEKELEADSRFQVVIRDFRTAFGIERLGYINTERREILAISIRIDAIVTFPDDFDFTLLLKRIFPWLGKTNVFEYKGKSDPLKVGQYYQYTFAELGLMLARCLSKERKDRTGRQWLSQKEARNYWNMLKIKGAKHLCSTTILSTADPRLLRQSLKFEPVDEYPHLRGALYRKVVSEDEFVGSAAVYLLALNKVKVCAQNVPLLLLSTGEKQKQFCRWLLTDAEGLTIEEQVMYRVYMLTYDIVEDEEVKKEMGRRKIKPNYDVFIELLHREGMSPEEQERFIQQFLGVSSPEEVAQKALGASSPEEVAQKALGASSPEEVAQKALGTSSPEEAAQKLLGVSSPEEALRKLSTLTR